MEVAHIRTRAILALLLGPGTAAEPSTWQGTHARIKSVYVVADSTLRMCYRPFCQQTTMVITLSDSSGVVPTASSVKNTLYLQYV